MDLTEIGSIYFPIGAKNCGGDRYFIDLHAQSYNKILSITIIGINRLSLCIA